jgi:hypothetical protein
MHANWFINYLSIIIRMVHILDARYWKGNDIVSKSRLVMGNSSINNEKLNEDA